jgi:hypothetical protein
MEATDSCKLCGVKPLDIWCMDQPSLFGSCFSRQICTLRTDSFASVASRLNSIASDLTAGQYEFCTGMIEIDTFLA